MAGLSHAQTEQTGQNLMGCVIRSVRGGVKLRKHFPTPFKNALKAAVAAYPEVKVELSDKEGIVLFPSPLPFHRDFVLGTNFTKVA